MGSGRYFSWLREARHILILVSGYVHVLLRSTVYTSWCKNMNKALCEDAQQTGGVPKASRQQFPLTG